MLRDAEQFLGECLDSDGSDFEMDSERTVDEESLAVNSLKYRYAPRELVHSQDENPTAPNVLTDQQTELLHKFWPMAEAYARAAFLRNNLPVSELDDFLSDAFFGLAKAVVRFDPAKASEHATTHSDLFMRNIKGEIARGIRDRFGRNGNKTERRKLSVIYGTISSLNEEIKTNNDSGASKEDLNPRSEVGYEFKTQGKPRKDRNKAGQRTDARIGVSTPSPTNSEYDYVLTLHDFERIIATLSERDEEIARRRFLLEETQQEIAEAVGVSQMQVSRIIRSLQENIAIRLAA